MRINHEHNLSSANYLCMMKRSRLIDAVMLKLRIEAL